MEGLEVTVLIGFAILIGTILAPRLRVATPLLLVAIGLALGFVPELRQIQLPPETVLLLFLPVMLFWESLTTSLRSIRRSLPYIVPMSTLLVLASAFAVAGIATLLGLPWEAALLLGAAVAPPDATAVAALGRLLPQRMFMKLKAESLTNDGTALVIYAIAVTLAVGGNVTPLSITWTVFVSYVGGAAVGISLAALAYLGLRRTRATLPINITLLLVPFTAFLLSEIIGASGVLAVVFAGLILAWSAPRITTAPSRQQAMAAWPFGVYLLNGALFVLIGLEVQHILHEIAPREIVWLSVLSVVAWLTLTVVRYVFQILPVPFARMTSPYPRGAAPGGRMRARVVSTMAGFRGAVSMAIALSVPLATDSGAPIDGRDAVVFVTAGVIMLSLVVQGTLLPTVVRWARLPADNSAAEEFELAQRAISGAALAALDDLAAEHGISDEVRDRARRDGYERLEFANAVAYARARSGASTRASAGSGDDAEIAELETMLGASPAADSGLIPLAVEGESVRLEMLATSTDIDLTLRTPVIRHAESIRLKLAVMDRKREVLLRLRREGTIDDLVMRRVESRLDLEEMRLSAPDDLD